MTMRRITRARRLTPEEAAKYQAIREQVVQELPDLIARHHERMTALDQLDELLQQLKAAREERGLSLADLTELYNLVQLLRPGLLKGEAEFRRQFGNVAALADAARRDRLRDLLREVMVRNTRASGSISVSPSRTRSR